MLAWFLKPAKTEKVACKTDHLWLGATCKLHANPYHL